MKPICMNCRYVGSIDSKDGLVCSRTRNFETVKISDTCDDYTQGSCERCGNDDISFYRHSPDDEPYVIRTEYRCKQCKAYWYEDD